MSWIDTNYIVPIGDLNVGGDATFFARSNLTTLAPLDVYVAGNVYVRGEVTVFSKNVSRPTDVAGHLYVQGDIFAFNPIVTLVGPTTTPTVPTTGAVTLLGIADAFPAFATPPGHLSQYSNVHPALADFPPPATLLRFRGLTAASPSMVVPFDPTSYSISNLFWFVSDGSPPTLTLGSCNLPAVGRISLDAFASNLAYMCPPALVDVDGKRRPLQFDAIDFPNDAGVSFVPDTGMLHVDASAVVSSSSAMHDARIVVTNAYTNQLTIPVNVSFASNVARRTPAYYL